MTKQTQFLACALALALAACSGGGSESPPSDRFAAATPDVSGLTLELQDGGLVKTTSASASLETTDAIAPSGFAPRNELQITQAALGELNGVVGLVVGKIAETIAAGGPQPSGDRKLYGPADRCVVGTDPASCTRATFLLAVTHVRDEVYAWRLDAWPVGGDPAAAQGVSVGWMARGEVEHRGVGRLVLDLDHLASAVPEYAGRGVLLAGFASGPMGKAVTYRLRGFTPDAAVRPPAWFTITGFRNLVTGTSRARVATVAEVVPPPGGETDRGPELVRSELAWNPPIGGRSFGVITNWYDPFLRTLLLPEGPFGDVPYTLRFDEHYFHVRACYAPFTAALVFKQSFLCNGPGSDAPEPPPACVARVGSANGTVLYPPEPAGDDTWELRCTLDGADHPGLVEPSSEPSTTPDDGAGIADGLEGLPPPPAPPADSNDVAPPPAEG
jgi:hypothetical protein